MSMTSPSQTDGDGAAVNLPFQLNLTLLPSVVMARKNNSDTVDDRKLSLHDLICS